MARKAFVAGLVLAVLAGCGAPAARSEPPTEPQAGRPEPARRDGVEPGDDRFAPRPRRRVLATDQGARGAAEEAWTHNVTAAQERSAAEEAQRALGLARRRAVTAADARAMVALDDALTAEAERQAEALAEVARIAQQRHEKGVEAFASRARMDGGDVASRRVAAARDQAAQARRRTDALSQLVGEALRRAAHAERLARAARAEGAGAVSADRAAIRAATEVTELKRLRAQASAEARWALEAVRRLQAEGRRGS